MSKITRNVLWLGLIFVVIIVCYQLYPQLLFYVSGWQKSFNQELSTALHQLNEHRHQAGLTLVAISFGYGVFHAVGPGHGKFILTSYLALEKTKLRQALGLSLMASMVQGIVAVALVSVIAVVLQLSRRYFHISLQWLESASFILLILLGFYWCYLAYKALCKPKASLKIKRILQNSEKKRPLTLVHHHTDAAQCSCGHQHLPNQQQMTQLQTRKARLMLILTIGSRPCSGAILVLFLAYTLDIFAWGVVSALVMALGTGLTLSLFAMVVLFARSQAVSLRSFYAKNTSQWANWLRFGVGIILIAMGVLLLHSLWLTPVTSSLFQR